MAVTRQEVMARLTTVEEAEYAAWEAKIDSALRVFDGSDKLIDCNASKRVRERLIDTYTRAGWTVTFEHGDQRDPGPWLRFK